MRGALLALALLAALVVRAGNPILDALPTNGLRVMTQPTTASQVVSVSLLIDFSALDEPADYAGLRTVLLTSMLCGSQEYSGSAIRRKLAVCGGVIEGRVHPDVLELSVRVPAGAAGLALRMLAEIVCHPMLEDADITAAIEQAQTQVETPPATTVGYADRMTESTLYDRHPYLNRGRGTYESLGHLNAPIVRWAYQTYVVPRATVLAVVGRGPMETVLPVVREAFGAWPDRPRPSHPVWDQPILKQSATILHEEPVRNTCVMMAFPVCGVTHPDFVTLRVIESLLAGGTSGRLFRSVRERQHLAYEVATRFPAQVTCSHFALYALTGVTYQESTHVATIPMENVRAAMAAEIVRLQTTPVPDADLQRAKAYLKGRYLVGHQYSAQYAFDLAWYLLQDLGPRYDATYLATIDRVSAADVQRVARSYFTNYLLTVVMPRTIANDD